MNSFKKNKVISIESTNNKDNAISLVKRNGRNIEFISEELRNDKDVLMEAVKNYGRAIKYASEELRNDKDVAMEAIHNNSESFRYATDLENSSKRELPRKLSPKLCAFHHVPFPAIAKVY